MNIPDEAVEAARKGFMSVDEPDLSEGLQLQYRLNAALAAALPSILEEMARCFDGSARQLYLASYYEDSERHSWCARRLRSLAKLEQNTEIEK